MSDKDMCTESSGGARQSADRSVQLHKNKYCIDTDLLGTRRSLDSVGMSFLGKTPCDAHFW